MCVRNILSLVSMDNKKGRRFIFLWDIFISLLATYAAIEIPVDMVIEPAMPWYLIFLNWLVVIAFIADVAIRFYNISIHNKIQEHKGTKKIYPKGWLVVDIAAALPFELIPGFSFLRALRLLKVFRVNSFRSTWLYRSNFNPVIVRLSFFSYFLGLSAHVISCIWLYLRLPADIAGAGKPVDIVNEYVRSLYWSITTITTIGYGDFVPNHNRNVEMIFTMCVQILGAGAYGYIIGNIANMLTNIDLAKTRHQERVDRMSSFMKLKKIPERLQEQVYQYYNYLWETRRGYDDVTILSELPASFQFEFAMLLNKSIIEKVPLFQGAESNLIREVIFKLKPCIYIPGDAICTFGEIGDKMYFINKGTVEVVSHDGKQVYALLKDGDFFGEIALLLKQPRNATIRAMNYCDLYSLDKDSFDGVISHYPDFEKNIKKLAHERMRAFAN